jgi:hypothetical protein
MAVCGSQLSRSLCGGPAASARQEVSDFTRRAGEPAPFRVPHHILPEHLARFFSLLIKLFGFWHLERLVVTIIGRLPGVSPPRQCALPPVNPSTPHAIMFACGAERTSLHMSANDPWRTSGTLPKRA